MCLWLLCSDTWTLVLAAEMVSLTGWFVAVVSVSLLLAAVVVLMEAAAHFYLWFVCRRFAKRVYVALPVEEVSSACR